MKFTPSHKNNQFVLLASFTGILCFFISVILMVKAFSDRFVYGLLALLPVTFAFCFIFILLPIIFNRKSLTAAIFSFCESLRMVMMPFFYITDFEVRCGSYSAPDPLLEKSILLMAYEMVFCSLFFYFFYSLRKRKDAVKEHTLYFKEGKSVILLVAIICLGIFLADPGFRTSLSFFVIRQYGHRMSSLESGDGALRNYLFVLIRNSVYCLYLVFIYKLYQKYARNHCQKRYFIQSLILTLLFVAVIFGEQREFQVYFAFASIYILQVFYPEQRNKIVRIILIFTGMVLVLMSLYKHLYVFMYDSYADAVKKAGAGLDVVGNFNYYLLGPNTIAPAMALKQNNDVFTLPRLLYDFLRSFAGIGGIFAIPGYKTTTVIYNLFLTGGKEVNGLLLPICAQGYMYFGFFFAPLLVVFFLRGALFLESIMKKSESLVLVFFCAFLYSRYSTCVVASNINTIITQTSLVLITIGFIYMLQWFSSQLQKMRR